MKKIIILILCLFPFILIGQSSNQNYVKKTVYKTPVQLSIDWNTGDDYLAPVADNLKDVSITYYNGLGVPIQNIDYKKSDTGNDIVTHFEYDAFGRQEKEYLPYATLSSSLDYITDPQTEISTYYNNLVYENTNNPYSRKLFENSPLNRIVKQAAPGNHWELGTGHEIKLDYQTNSTADNVKLFSITAIWNSTMGVYTIPSSLITTVNYNPNKLFKTITKDENWKTTDGSNNTVEEFKDIEGKVILKRTYNSSVQHDTYYVYDQYGNLTFVLPPAVNINSTVTNSILDGLCYQYKYDKNNRLVEKKLPGKQWEFIVYDKLDRVVASGPALSPFANLSGNGWMITKYDAFNRAIYTGWLPMTTVNSDARKIMQAQFNAETTNFSETKTATTTNTIISGVAIRYSNVAIPTSGYHILTVNYYDDYNFPHAPTPIPATVEGQTVYYNTTVKPKGLPTGSYVRVLESSTNYNAETSYTLYDSRARPIRNYKSNYLGGFTQVDTKLDFIGKTNYTITTHKRLSSSLLIKVTDAFTYTQQDRLLTHTHQINDGDIQLLTKNEYDDLGQLIVKRVGGTDLTGSIPLQKVDYTYNIRGWLKEINSVNDLSSNSDPQDLFAFKINYNEVENETNYTGKELYNGNISETYWRTASDNRLRKYGYYYDDLNRLKSAIYQKPGTTVVVTNSYNESMDYDKNGNILYLQRTGEYDDPSQYLLIDELKYYYDTNRPNQLAQVDDLIPNPNGFKNGTNTGIDYTYDDYGNMTSDLNKKIIRIDYNNLNLPVRIIFDNGDRIDYIYNSVGVKVKKSVRIGSVQTNTDYLDGFQYTNAVLDFFPHKEGYVKNTFLSNTNNYNYAFNYTDHLGNIRITYGLDPNEATNLIIMEENNYYPFGLNHKNYNVDKRTYGVNGEGIRLNSLCALCDGTYKYKYNGKELQDELGLNWYDYQARNYDPAIGRWMNIDPLAETSRRFSPYTYALDNPVSFIDPDGMQADDWRKMVNGKSEQVYDPTANGGKGAYTEHASKQDIYIGNALKNSSPTGAEQFDKLVNSKQEIEIVVNGDEIPVQKDGSIDFGATITPKENNPEGKSTITLFTASINYLAEGIEENSKTGEGAKTYLGDVDVTGMNFKDILAATLGEEVEHTTQENISLQHSGVSRDKVEEKPREISTKIFQEISNKKKP